MVAQEISALRDLGCGQRGATLDKSVRREVLTTFGDLAAITRAAASASGGLAQIPIEGVKNSLVSVLGSNARRGPSAVPFADRGER
jgi:hypothetical protein